MENEKNINLKNHSNRGIELSELKHGKREKYIAFLEADVVSFWLLLHKPVLFNLFCYGAPLKVF